VPPADRGVEALAQRLHDPVARPQRKVNLPRGDLIGHPLKLAQWHVAKRDQRVAQPVAQRRDRAPADAYGVTFEEHRHERGECVFDGWPLAAQLVCDHVSVVVERRGLRLEAHHLAGRRAGPLRRAGGVSVAQNPLA
jgi:hypothetical protein